MNSLIQKAFTLIELLVVIAVIGILSGLIIVSMNGVASKATIAKGQIFSNSLKNSLMANLISEWKLDEGEEQVVADSWSSINNGRLGSTASIDNNDPTWTTSGCISGNCLSFDGINDYVNLGNWDLVGVSRTISIWINPKTSPALMPDKRFFSANYYDVRFNGGILEIRIYDTAFRYLTCNASIFNSNTWYNISISSNENDMRLYVNGELKDQSFILSLTSHPYNLNIGANYAGDNRFFNGLIDEVQIYDAAIPTSKIREHYLSGLNSLLASNQIDINQYINNIKSIANK